MTNQAFFQVHATHERFPELVTRRHKHLHRGHESSTTSGSTVVHSEPTGGYMQPEGETFGLAQL